MSKNLIISWKYQKLEYAKKLRKLADDIENDKVGVRDINWDQSNRDDWNNNDNSGPEFTIEIEIKGIGLYL